jgi:hypothetical protein
MLQELLSSDVPIGWLLFPHTQLLSEALFNQIWIGVKATVLLVAATSLLLNKKDLLLPSRILSSRRLCNSLPTFELFAATPILVIRLDDIASALVAALDIHRHPWTASPSLP